MSLRRTLLVASLLVFPFVFAAAAGAAKPDRTPPTAPSNLRITASTSTSVSLAWDAGKDNSSNWWYCLRRDGFGCIRVDPPQTTLSLSRLLPHTTFNWSVIAVDAHGNRSAASNTVTYTTPPDTSPPTAPSLSLTGTWPTRVTVAWTLSVDDTSQVGYTLLADGSRSFADRVSLRDATVLDLAPGTTHTFKVLARDAAGNTSESNVVTVTTPEASDRTPPSAPTNLRLSPESFVPEIWLAWDQSTDDIDPQAQILYDVYLNGVPKHAAIGRGDTIVYCSGEGPNTITLRAIDSSGNASAFSNELTFC